MRADPGSSDPTCAEPDVRRERTRTANIIVTPLVFGGMVHVLIMTELVHRLLIVL